MNRLSHFLRGGFLPLALLGLLALAGLSACGGGSGGDADSEAAGSGTLNISLTDAEGDFLTYTVDVQSLTLTKANGTVVETLPLNTRVDFARYTDMTEFLTAATVPAGVYVRGVLTLDYSNADIQVEGADGNAVKVTSITDADGKPVTTLDASVRLEGRNRLVIAPGIPMNLSLDFDLAASNTVSFDSAGTTAAIEVEPVLIAELDTETNKVQRVRGPLQNVNLQADTFHVHIRPFYHRLRRGERHFGALRVISNDDTLYEIDGQSYQGHDGLRVLSEQTRFTAVIVRGTLKFKPVRFEAEEVYAGSSVPGGDMDVVTGSVMARSGDSLTLRGVTLMRSNGSVVFNDQVTVQLADSTTVKKQLSMDSFAIDAISVGQRLTVFGTLTDDRISSLELDAANGHARMLLGSVRGEVVRNDGDFNLNLSSINGRNPSLYDFSGTGVDAGNDADPTNYEIATTSLDVSGFGTGTRVAVRGFPTPFGSAPEDFTAQSVISR